MTQPWPSVPLGEVLTERQEQPSPDDLALGRVKIVGKISFESGCIQLRANGETKTGMILARPGDLVVSGINAAKGAIAVYGEENIESIAATIHYGAYVPNRERVSVDFLWWLLRSSVFKDLLLEYVPGGIKTELKAKRLLPIPIPLPTLAEQQRIVARIDALAGQIREAQRLRQEAIEQADALRGMAAKAGFNGNWPRARLEDVCEIITDGTHQTPQYVEADGYTFLSAQNIKPFRFMPETHRKVSYEDYVGCQKRVKPQKGDVLLTRVGAGIGEAAVIDRDIDFAFYVSLALIRPSPEKLVPELLTHWLNSPEGIWQSRGQTLGKGHSQGNLNLKLLRGFDIPLPPLPEQCRIVAELDTLQAHVGTLKHAQAETAAELDALLPAILAKAFRGEL